MQEKPDGHMHPISQAIHEIVTIFGKMGFSFASGPELESEYYNFDALNIPKDHPSRDMQDTFWVDGRKLSEAHKETIQRGGEGFVLRTHTSPVQVRYMRAHEPPIRIVVPGRTYRNEATDATHETQFHQVEGLMVDTDVTLADLKGVFDTFFSEFFGLDANTRLRPGFFPFVEPGVEVDMSCFRCSGGGCSLCKKSGWIELFGAGMVHPKVLEAGGINPRDYQGFAFGGGIERLLMLRHGIGDIRLFSSGDLRFINQF